MFNDFRRIPQGAALIRRRQIAQSLSCVYTIEDQLEKAGSPGSEAAGSKITWKNVRHSVLLFRYVKGGVLWVSRHRLQIPARRKPSRLRFASNFLWFGLGAAAMLLGLSLNIRNVIEWLRPLLGDELSVVWPADTFSHEELLQRL